MRHAHVPSTTLSVPELAHASASRLSLSEVERRVADLLGTPEAVLFASARGALAASVAILAAEGKVGVPAYTCVAVPNAVTSGGGLPCWMDVDSCGRLALPILPDLNAVVVQDTYGFAAPVPPNIAVIRDASHRVDLLTDRSGVCVTVTSFEHSKWLSAGRGGLAVAQDSQLAARLRQRRDDHRCKASPLRAVVFTGMSILSGRLLFRGRRTLGVLFDRFQLTLDRDRQHGQTALENSGYGVDPRLLGPPDAISARLILSQLQKMDTVGTHRACISARYDRAFGIERKPLPLVRYPVLVKDRVAAHEGFRAAGWDLGRPWFDAPLHPSANDCDFSLVRATAPSAVYLAGHVLNLPTHTLVTPGDADSLADVARQFEAIPLVER